jgi:hypothetical protein
VAGTAAASDRMGLAFDYGSTANNGNVLTQVVSVPGATFAQTYGLPMILSTAFLPRFALP